MLPTWLFLFCVAAAWWGRKDERMLCVFLVACVFGASAALTVFLLGNAPVTPAIFFIPFLVAAVFRQHGLKSWLQGLSLREPGGWLALFVGWAVLSAVFLPRLFQGELRVFTTSRANTLDLGVQLAWLAPNSTNITQSVYVICSLLVFLSFRSLAQKRSGQLWLVRGIHAAALINILFVAWDALSFFSRMDLGLSFIRNANYAIVSQSIGAWPRLQGAFSEPSSLAGFTVVLVGLLLPLWLRGIQPRATGLLTFGSIAVLLLTLSSTAMIVLVFVLLLSTIAHALQSTVRTGPKTFGWASALMLVTVSVACILALWMPPWLMRFLDIASVMIFEKASSESGIERWSWVTSNWDNFIATYGVGVGLGSERGSSFPVVMLGNLGWPGAVLWLVFFLWVMLSKPGSDVEAGSVALVSAIRLALLGGLCSASLTASNVDLGALFYALAGAVVGSLRSGELKSVTVSAPTDVRLRVAT